MNENFKATEIYTLYLYEVTFLDGTQTTLLAESFIDAVAKAMAIHETLTIKSIILVEREPQTWEVAKEVVQWDDYRRVERFYFK